MNSRKRLTIIVILLFVVTVIVLFICFSLNNNADVPETDSSLTNGSAFSLIDESATTTESQLTQHSEKTTLMTSREDVESSVSESPVSNQTEDVTRETGVSPSKATKPGGKKTTPVSRPTQTSNTTTSTLNTTKESHNWELPEV